MTREEFKPIAAALRAAYGKDKVIPDKSAFEVWLDLLKDLDGQVVKAAAESYASTEHFPPVPADIRKKAAEINQLVYGYLMSEGEAWALVRKAIGNGIYGYESEFSKMPEEIQKSIGSSTQLRIWAMDENFDEGVVQSQFLRSYRQVIERKKQMDLLPLEVRETLMRIGTADQELLEEKK